MNPSLTLRRVRRAGQNISYAIRIVVLAFSLFAPPARSQPSGVQVDWGSVSSMKPEELARHIEDLLGSADPAASRKALALASLGGRRLAGAPVLDKMRAHYAEVDDIDRKYAIVDSLAAIGDPRSREFFSQLLRTSDPVSARIRAVRYLVGEMELLRHEVEPAIHALLEGLASAADQGPVRRPLEAREAWMALGHIIGRYQLPVIDSAEIPPDKRARAAVEWWLRERENVISAFPRGPRLLKLRHAAPYKVYDWDEGISLLSGLLEGHDEVDIRKAANLAIEAKDQLVGTEIVQRLELASDRLKASPSPTALELRRKVMLALIAIDDPASRNWLLGQLGPSQEMVLRILAAKHLSDAPRLGEANTIMQVVCDMAKLPDGATFYVNSRMQEESRRLVDVITANLADSLKLTKITVDWARAPEIRGTQVEKWRESFLVNEKP